jgi:thiol-disulfide isomerase/thioredoxin
MVFIDEINTKNCMNGTCNMITKLDKYLADKNAKIFLLIFMEGCKPCEATRPEWSKIKNVLKDKFSNRNDVVVAAIDQQLAGKLKNLKFDTNTFPTLKFITNGGLTSESYEDSKIIGDKDRKIDSFIEWINLKIGENEQNHNKSLQKSRTHSGGARKWSRKYKKSINCNRPKGFSQKQYCKYGRKHSKKHSKKRL